jgi:hypothetical protein
MNRRSWSGGAIETNHFWVPASQTIAFISIPIMMNDMLDENFECFWTTITSGDMKWSVRLTSLHIPSDQIVRAAHVVPPGITICAAVRLWSVLTKVTFN